MKASELIERLLYLQQEHGDLEVETRQDGEVDFVYEDDNKIIIY